MLSGDEGRTGESKSSDLEPKLEAQRRIELIIEKLTNPRETLAGIQELSNLSSDDPYLRNIAIYKTLIGRFQVENSKKCKRELIDFLEKYRRVLGYISGVKELNEEADRAHRVLEFLRKLFNTGGIVSGETISIVSKITSHIAPMILVIAQAVSYISYGITSLIHLIKSSYWVAKRNNPPLHNAIPAHTYIGSNIFSAVINGLVFLAFLSVALILIGTIPMPVGLVALKTGVAYSIAAVGTLLHWFGNHFINYLCAKTEYNDLVEFEPIFHGIQDLGAIKNSKAEAYKSQQIHALLGVAMVVGMVLLAAVNLSPLFPLLTIVPLLSKASIACMVISASSEILSVADWLCHKAVNTGKSIFNFAKTLFCGTKKEEDSLQRSPRVGLDHGDIMATIGGPPSSDVRSDEREEKRRGPIAEQPRLPLTSSEGFFKPARHPKYSEESLNERQFRVAKC